MGQDIRKMFAAENEESSHSLPKGHTKRFQKKLNKALPQEPKQGYMWLKIAAVLIIVFGVSFFYLYEGAGQEVQVVEVPVEKQQEEKTSENAFALSDISPEYKKVEDYYMASINVEISKLSITPENKALIDSFMTQLSALDEEYKKLNLELAEAGINEQTIEALVDNLELRLELLLQLKQKLKELKQKENEKYTSNIS